MSSMNFRLGVYCLVAVSLLDVCTGRVADIKREGQRYWTDDDLIAPDFSHIFTQCSQQGGQPFTFASLEEARNITASLSVGAVEVYVPAIQLNSSYYWFSVHPYHNVSNLSPTFFSDDVIDRVVRKRDCVILIASRFEAQECSAGFRFVCQKDLNQTKNDNICNNTSDTPTAYNATVTLHEGQVTPSATTNQPAVTFPTAIADPSITTDNSDQQQCVRQADGSCAPYVGGLLGFFGKNNAGTGLSNLIHGRQGPLTPEEHTPWSIINLLQANRNRTDVKKETIRSMDVSNLTHEEADSALKAIYQLLLTDNSTLNGLDHRVVALFFKMADVPFVDDDMLTTYVKGTALIIYDEDQRAEKKESQGARILLAMERVLSKTNASVHEQRVDQLVVKVKEVNMTYETEDITLTSQLHKKRSVIHLSRSLFPNDQGRVSTVEYANLHRLLPSNRKGALKGGKVASHVISIVVDSGKKHNKGQGRSGHLHPLRSESAVNFTLPFLHLKTTGTEAQRWCVYWKFNLRVWSDDGCWRVEGNQSHTTCCCRHLSTFAVLVTFTKGPPDTGLMVVLTAIGCTLSIAGLALTLITYVYLRIALRERVFIHANLALSLLLAQILFIASDTAHQHEVACKVVAGLLHFFFLASFSWMMVEGATLYRTCTRGLPIAPSASWDLRCRCCLLGWGLPLLIVVISVGLQFPHYGAGVKNSCWLSVEEGVIWAFLAPMLLIVSVNAVILGLVLRMFLALKTNCRKTQAARVRAGLRAMGILFPLLGSTWLLSLLVPLSAVFTYLFILCNSLQGLMIFLLHCLGNEEVRRFLARRRIPSRSRTSDSHLSVVSRRYRSPVLNFDDVKLGMAAEGHITSREGRRNAWV